MSPDQWYGVLCDRSVLAAFWRAIAQRATGDGKTVSYLLWDALANWGNCSHDYTVRAVRYPARCSPRAQKRHVYNTIVPLVIVLAVQKLPALGQHWHAGMREGTSAWGGLGWLLPGSSTPIKAPAPASQPPHSGSGTTHPELGYLSSCLPPLAVLQLERELDANATAGQCERGKPLLPGTPGHVCKPVHCLWSHTLQLDVDLSFNVLQQLPGWERGRGGPPEGGGGRAKSRWGCPRARGGQAGPPASPQQLQQGQQQPGQQQPQRQQQQEQQPLVSLILLAGSGGSDELAAQTLLQLFRTATEVPSAEFVIVDPGASAGGLLRAAAASLEAYFGTRLRFVGEGCSSNGSGGGGGGASGGTARVRNARWAAAQRGLQAASGTHAVLVTAGTFVLRGWLHALASTLESNPQAAVVGPLVLHPTGTVAEAGGLLHPDGSVTVLGAGEALSPESSLLHLQHVDFVGSSCMAFRRQEVLEAGGFDDRLPSRFADADLALRLQKHGLQVLLQPLAVVARQPSGSRLGAASASGTSSSGSSSGRGDGGDGSRVGSGAEQEGLNAQLLLNDKWQCALRHWDAAAAGEEGGSAEPGAAKAAGQQGNSSSSSSSSSKGGRSPSILWIDDWIPMPDKDSGSVRSLELIRILVQEGYQVSMQPKWEAERSYMLQVRAAGLRVLPAGPVNASIIQAPGGGCAYDAFIVSRRPNYKRCYELLDAVCPGVPQIFDTVDLHFLREVRAELAARGLANITRPDDVMAWMNTAAPVLASEGDERMQTLVQQQQVELKLIAKAGATLVVSDDEIKFLNKHLPQAADHIFGVSNVHEKQGAAHQPGMSTNLAAAANPPGCAARHGLLFVGNYAHQPNIDAVVFLLEEVLPRVRVKLSPRLAGELVAHLVGAGTPSEELLALVARHSKYAQFHGHLPDDLLHMLYSSVKVAVAPLTVGAGVKGKVNQAMKLGVPVVATRLAMEGMHARDGVDCMVADSAEEFADKVVAVYEDCALWERLVEGGFVNLQQHFSRGSARAALLHALGKAGLAPPRPRLACSRDLETGAAS